MLKGYIKAIKGVPLRFPTERNKISEKGKDLLMRMLKIDPKERMDWDDICKHNIFVEKLKESADIREAIQKKQNQWKLNVYFQFCRPYEDKAKNTDYDTHKGSP